MWLLDWAACRIYRHLAGGRCYLLSLVVWFKMWGSHFIALHQSLVCLSYSLERCSGRRRNPEALGLFWWGKSMPKTQRHAFRQKEESNCKYDFQIKIQRTFMLLVSYFVSFTLIQKNQSKKSDLLRIITWYLHFIREGMLNFTIITIINHFKIYRFSKYIWAEICHIFSIILSLHDFISTEITTWKFQWSKTHLNSNHLGLHRLQVSQYKAKINFLLRMIFSITAFKQKY